MDGIDVLSSMWENKQGHSEHEKEEVEARKMHQKMGRGLTPTVGIDKWMSVAGVGDDDLHGSNSSPPVAEKRGKVGGSRGEAADSCDTLGLALNREEREKEERRLAWYKHDAGNRVEQHKVTRRENEREIKCRGEIWCEEDKKIMSPTLSLSGGATGPLVSEREGKEGVVSCDCCRASSAPCVS